jgi:hypothetical protein
MSNLADYIPLSRCDHDGTLASAKWWIADLIGKPHPDANKEGPICPGIPAAVGNDSIYLKKLLGEVDYNSVLQEVMRTKDAFLHLDPVHNPARLLKAVFLVFPPETDKQSIPIIDVVHRDLKGAFLSDGILVGKFHRKLVRGSIYNPDFNPHRSPVPLMAFRYLIETDLDFLISTSATCEIRDHYIRKYLALLGETASPALVEKARLILER